MAASITKDFRPRFTGMDFVLVFTKSPRTLRLDFRFAGRFLKSDGPGKREISFLDLTLVQAGLFAPKTHT